MDGDNAMQVITRAPVLCQDFNGYLTLKNLVTDADKDQRRPTAGIG